MNHLRVTFIIVWFFNNSNNNMSSNKTNELRNRNPPVKVEGGCRFYVIEKS